jgi:hypothetical protein
VGQRCQPLVVGLAIGWGSQSGCRTSGGVAVDGERGLGFEPVVEEEVVGEVGEEAGSAAGSCCPCGEGGGDGGGFDVVVVDESWIWSRRPMRTAPVTWPTWVAMSLSGSTGCVRVSAGPVGLAGSGCTDTGVGSPKYPVSVSVSVSVSVRACPRAPCRQRVGTPSWEGVGGGGCREGVSGVPGRALGRRGIVIVNGDVAGGDCAGQSVTDAGPISLTRRARVRDRARRASGRRGALGFLGLCASPQPAELLEERETHFRAGDEAEVVDEVGHDVGVGEQLVVRTNVRTSIRRGLVENDVPAGTELLHPATIFRVGGVGCELGDDAGDPGDDTAAGDLGRSSSRS